MKVSYKWLSKLVNLDGITPTELANKLTFAGVEVEDVFTLASGTNLVVGETLEVENMPDSDHLHVCKVNLGSTYGVKQIVCGAPNVKAHQKVIVARDGAKLPGGVIKEGTIRGFASQGMLCSLLELGVDSKYLSEEQTKGIEILPDDAKVGDENVLGLLGLDDAVLDLKLLANRSDLNAMNNVAREVSTLFDREVSLEKAESFETKNFDFKVGIETPNCDQFSARVIKGITIKESPLWMQHYLRSMGVRSINNIVDIGNYIMLLTGQPLHMYDLDKLPKNELIVKDNNECDFVALDEKTYKLQQDDITICSDDKVMCLGGVMGSLACAVDENTKNIVIEAANFHFANIRRTSNRLGLVSESSQRFVKGINPNQYDYVMDLSTKVIKELCGADEIGQIITLDKKEHKNTVINTSVKKINARLGTEFTHEQIVSILRKDGMEINENGDDLEVVVPFYRIDMSWDADVSEEVIRLYGFDNVKSELPVLSQTVGSMTENVAKKRLVRDYLKGCGLDEVVTYSLVRKNDVNLFRDLCKSEPVHIINPMTDEHEFLRTNLLHSLLEVARFNVARQNDNLHYFEVSDIDSETEKQTHLGIVLLGSDLYQGYMKKEPYSFFTMKGYLEGLMNMLNIEPNRYTIEPNTINTKEYHPYKSAVLKMGKDVLVIFGEVHPQVKAQYDLGNTPVIVMEAKLDKLFEVRSGKKKFAAPSKFPVVSRDLALIVDEKVSVKSIVDIVKKTGKSLVKDVFIFDEYKGEHLEPGKKSIAFTVKYQSEETTLTDAMVSELENRVLLELEKNLGAKLRS